MRIKDHYDWVIIGSGFGGSVSALRLAEKGYSVLVIEKGKRYDHTDFPKTNWNLRKWFWLPGLKLFGIQKLTFLRHISILSGVGVGGGSLVYANTLPKPKSAFFRSGSWADLEEWESELAPWYDVAWKMLGAAENPLLSKSDLALRELSSRIGKPDCFQPTTVGVFFGDPEKEVSDPYFNGKGPDRKGCLHCGACMTGCRNNAKNSLDKNYLYLAQHLGAEILAEHKVIDVRPMDGQGKKGYSVSFRPSTKYFSSSKQVTANGVIFSGGVLGTVPLLLKLKKTSLSGISTRIGHNVLSNNEALILNTSLEKDPEYFKGIAIGSIVETDENSHLEPVRYGEGSGFWRPVMVPMVSGRNVFERLQKVLVLPLKSPLRWLKILFIRDFGKSTSILLFMQHLNTSLKFRRGIFGIKSVAEKGSAPTPFIAEAHELAKDYCRIINAEPRVMITETVAGIPSTAHILGGASMGKTSEEGVIDSHNRVFGYDNLYIFDGSMISSNPGVNPSLTITAITERGISKIPDKS
jgi:cholesterol oxidase